MSVDTAVTASSRLFFIRKSKVNMQEMVMKNYFDWLNFKHVSRRKGYRKTKKGCDKVYNVGEDCTKGCFNLRGPFILLCYI